MPRRWRPNAARPPISLRRSHRGCSGPSRVTPSIRGSTYSLHSSGTSGTRWSRQVFVDRSPTIPVDFPCPFPAFQRGCRGPAQETGVEAVPIGIAGREASQGLGMSLFEGGEQAIEDRAGGLDGRRRHPASRLVALCYPLVTRERHGKVKPLEKNSLHALPGRGGDFHELPETEGAWGRPLPRSGGG
jgi:hypothetical protein